MLSCVLRSANEHLRKICDIMSSHCANSQLVYVIKDWASALLFYLVIDEDQAQKARKCWREVCLVMSQVLAGVPFLLTHRGASLYHAVGLAAMQSCSFVEHIFAQQYS